jgi:hypothetical protein
MYFSSLHSLHDLQATFVPSLFSAFLANIDKRLGLVIDAHVPTGDEELHRSPDKLEMAVFIEARLARAQRSWPSNQRSGPP